MTQKPQFDYQTIFPEYPPLSEKQTGTSNTMKGDLTMRLHRRDKEILGTYYTDYELYGVNYDGSRAYLSVQYDGRALPEFDTVIIDPEDSAEVYYKHPRRCGVTKSDNWSVNPELLGKDWKVR